MPQRLLVVATMFTVLLAGGCGPAATLAPPTATPAPPTATPVPSTPAPPTALPTPEPTATPNVPFEEVTFTTEDEINIAGTLFGEGEIVVLLLHMGKAGATQKSWHPFARLVAERGFSVLAIDFRGCGKSEGTRTLRLLINDARAAVEFLRQRGFDRFICMGASMGGTTCMRLALEVDLEGLGVLASTMSLGDPTQVSERDLAQLTMPKLFVVGEWDYIDVVIEMDKMYQAAGQPKEMVSYGNAAHGTDLFLSPYGDDLRQQLLDFLEGLR